MSSRKNHFPSIAAQKKVINADINLNLVAAYVLGVYIGIYGLTILAYYHNTTLKRKGVIIGSLTVLFSAVFAENIIDWYIAALTFVSETKSRRATFLNITEGVLITEATVILGDILNNVGFVVADGLMIWRCFHACGTRVRGHFFLPLILFIAEIALIITETVLQMIMDLNPAFVTPQRIDMIDNLANAMFCTVAVASLTSTLVICYHIYSTTSKNRRSWQRYKHIVDIMVQSSLAYTSVMIMQSVVGFLDTTPQQQNSLSIISLQTYTDFLTSISSGLAPTLMVARLAIASENKSTEEIDYSMSLPSDVVADQELDHMDCGPPIGSVGSVVTIHDISAGIGEETV